MLVALDPLVRPPEPSVGEKEFHGRQSLVERRGFIESDEPLPDMLVRFQRLVLGVVKKGDQRIRGDPDLQ
jgi:hypothetical protein